MDEVSHRRRRMSRPTYADLAWPPSHRQPLANLALHHVLALARQHAGAAVHHHIIVGEVARPFEILFDDQNRQTAALPQIEDGPPNVADDRRLNSLGRLI